MCVDGNKLLGTRCSSAGTDLLWRPEVALVIAEQSSDPPPMPLVGPPSAQPTLHRLGVDFGDLGDVVDRDLRLDHR
jgi:hypothetical protein